MTLASVNIYRQFSLSVHFAHIFVEPLLKLIMFRETCIENCTLPIFLAKADSAHERRFDLLDVFALFFVALAPQFRRLSGAGRDRLHARRALVPFLAGDAR